MAISRLGRITTAPAGAVEMLAGDAALVAAVIADRPGRTHIQQAKASDRASGARRGDPLGSARAAVEDAPAILRPGGVLAFPRHSSWKMPASPLRDGRQPVHGEKTAVPRGERDARRRAWPAPPPPQLRPGPAQAPAARRGGELS